MCRTGHFLQTSGDQISGCPGPNKFLHVFSLLRGKGHQFQHPLEIDTSSPSANRSQLNSTLPSTLPSARPLTGLPPSTQHHPPSFRSPAAMRTGQRRAGLRGLAAIAREAVAVHAGVSDAALRGVEPIASERGGRRRRKRGGAGASGASVRGAGEGGNRWL